jgi:hypothetical protein
MLSSRRTASILASHAKCLDVNGGGYWQNVHMWDCDANNKNQLFYVRDNWGDGYVYLVEQSSGSER